MFDDNTVKKIQEDISALVNDMSSLRREIGSKGSAKVEELRADASQRLSNVRDQAADKAKSVDRYAHEQPWIAAAVAVAVAVVVTAIFQRRGRD